MELVGTNQKVSWKTEESDALRVELPKAYKPKVDYAAVLKVTLT